MGCGRGLLIVGGLLVGLIIIGALAGGSKPAPLSGTDNTFSPEPSPTPISAAKYKASAKHIPYRQLEKDPDALAGTIVVYTGQVVQYDSATTTFNLRINVTPDGFGGYDDTIWLDVDPAATSKVFRNSIIEFWGEVVGAYTYETVTGGQTTIPEVDVRFIHVVKS
jgi:hypothetical protein